MPNRDESRRYAVRYRLAPLLVKLRENQRCRGLFQDRIHQALPLADAFPGNDYESHVQRLRTSLEKSVLSVSNRWRYRSYLGCAYLRSGQYAEAIEWMEKPIEPEELINDLRVRDLSMLAIAYEETGDHAKAKELLSQAEELFTEASPKFGFEDGGRLWYEWLICELLLDEAKDKIGGGGEPDAVAPED